MKYDFIIIGAGSAGCVIASRLSENPTNSVLLVEAGPDYTNLENMPSDIKYGYDAASVLKGPHMWGYQANSMQGHGTTFNLPRGKVVGGSGAVNGQVWLRGMPDDYDNWADSGNAEWAFHKILPFLNIIESDSDFGGDFHGYNGPTPVFRHDKNDWLPSQHAFFQACRDVGIPECWDMNDPEATGVGPRPFNNVDGIRMSTALTYLDMARHRLNLTVRARTMVRRILFDGSRAIGIEADSGSESFAIEGQRIIVSCGAIASPQLLLLSGIGPNNQLRSLAIPIVNDLPGVGKNLRDHPLVSLKFRAQPELFNNTDILWSQVGLRYTTNGSTTKNDVQIFPIWWSTDTEGEPFDQLTIFRISAGLENAASSGELHIVSNDPYTHPAIDYNYLNDVEDRRKLREAIRLCIGLSTHTAFRDILLERITPTDVDLDTDETLDSWLLCNVTTQQHSAGTCKMGPITDQMAVVDQYCRVHGVDNLSIVDASVMPDVIRANTNLTTIMIAERVADWITNGKA